MRRLFEAGLRLIFAPESDRWLSVLRIGISTAAVIDCLSLRRDWLSFFSLDQTGPIKRDLVEALLSAESDWIPRLGWLVRVGTRLGLGETAVVSLIWWLLLLGGLLLLVGLFSQTAAITTALLHLCAVKSIGSMTYGFDNFSTIGLFYLAVGPLPDRLSLDRIMRRRPGKDPQLFGFFRNILRLHLSMAYLFGGITKCAGLGWWTGENLWRAMIRPPFNVISPDLIVAWRWLLPVAGVAVCLLETTYPIFVWPNRTRPFWLIAILTMHLVIGLLLGLYLFAFIMIVLNLAAFAPWPGDREILSTVAGESETIG